MRIAVARLVAARWRRRTRRFLYPVSPCAGAVCGRKYVLDVDGFRDEGGSSLALGVTLLQFVQFELCSFFSKKN